MKKAGLVIGIAVILLAVILFGVSQFIEKKNVEKINKQVETNQDIEQEPIVENIPNNTVADEPKIIEKTIEKTVERTISGVSTINKNTLGDVYLEKEEVVVIADKRLILIDESYGEKSGKMLSYCFDVLTTDNTKLILFMTAKAYDSYKIGDKLMVRYDIYKNVNDIKFPVVLSVSPISE